MERIQGWSWTMTKGIYALVRLFITDNGNLRGEYERDVNVSKSEAHHDKLVCHYLGDSEVEEIKKEPERYNRLVLAGFDYIIEKNNKYIEGYKKTFANATNRLETGTSSDTNEDRDRVANCKNHIMELEDENLKTAVKKETFMKERDINEVCN